MVAIAHADVSVASVMAGGGVWLCMVVMLVVPCRG